MSNRTLSLSAAILAALVSAAPAFAGEAVLASTVDAPKVAIEATPADFAATQSPGTVGAMHYAVAGRPTSSVETSREGGWATAGGVRWTAAPAGPSS